MQMPHEELAAILAAHNEWLGSDEMRGKRADLRGVDLRNTILCAANLMYADLCDADLTGADLTGADLRGANLHGVTMTRATMTGAILADATLPYGVPIVPDLDRKILAAIENGGSLDMTTWHGCGTTHCRAGWAITLAGPAGAALETAYGPEAAGSLIYAASRPDRPIPDFFSSNEDAMASIKAGAAVQS